jgi:hypothetical protein
MQLVEQKIKIYKPILSDSILRNLLKGIPHWEIGGLILQEQVLGTGKFSDNGEYQFPYLREQGQLKKLSRLPMV